MEAQDSGIRQALRMVDAMDGQDVETREELWRAAKRYARRDREQMERTGWLDAARASL